MDIKKLNEAIAKALNEDTFYDNCFTIADYIRDGRLEGSEPCYWTLSNVYVNGHELSEFCDVIQDMILEQVAEQVSDGVDDDSNLPIILDCDRLREEDEHREAIEKDLVELFGISDEDIANIFNGNYKEFEYSGSYTVSVEEEIEDDIQYVDEWSITYKDNNIADEYFEEDETGAWERFNEIDHDKVHQFVHKTYKIVNGEEPEEDYVEVLYDKRLGIGESLKEDYTELKNDKSLDKYRAILDGNEKIDGYIFQDKKHVLIKFHNVTPKDRKQVIILDDKFEERLNKAYDKCRKVNESLKQTKSSKKSIKEEMEYNRKIWDIFEENVAEYLNEHGVKPEGNNVMKYISKNAAEIVKAVLNKNYDYEEDDQAIFELYYNCPIHFTDKAQAIDKLLEEYLAESLKRCLTIEDKLLQISSLDKNEAVIDKKSMKEDVNTVYVLIDNKVALNFEQDFNFAIDLLDADGLIKRAEELDKNFEQNAKEANLGSPLMNDVLYAIKVLRNSHYFVLIKNVH